MKKRIAELLLGLSVWLAELALKIYPVPYMPINKETALKIFGADPKNMDIPKSKYRN